MRKMRQAFGLLLLLLSNNELSRTYLWFNIIVFFCFGCMCVNKLDTILVVVHCIPSTFHHDFLDPHIWENAVAPCQSLVANNFALAPVTEINFVLFTECITKPVERPVETMPFQILSVRMNLMGISYHTTVPKIDRILQSDWLLQQTSLNFVKQGDNIRPNTLVTLPRILCRLHCTSF